MAAGNKAVEFKDYFPAMMEKLGEKGFLDELCKGFRVLTDADKGVITFESLKRNAAVLMGFQGLTDDELRCMLREGDLDGDGALNKVEFFFLMFRLSPGLMDGNRS